MKYFYSKLIAIIVSTIAISHGICAAQQVVLWPENNPIPAYSTPVDNIPESYIIQGALPDIWYYATIIGDSPLRFHLSVELLDPSNGNSLSNKTVWVNKTNCIVFVQANGYDETGGYIYLYESPQSSEFVKFYLNELPGELPVLSYKTIGNINWVEVLIYSDGVIYSGWINRYCGNFLNSCN